MVSLFVHPSYLESINKKNPFCSQKPIAIFANPTFKCVMCLFYYMIRLFALHWWFFIIYAKFIDNTRVVKSKAQRWKTMCFLRKDLNKEWFLFPRMENKIRCDEWASRRKYLLRWRKRRLHQQGRKVCMGEKLVNSVKGKTIKVNLMHRYFIHAKSYIT